MYMEEIHIGLDDTDSHNGMCTTYIGSRILKDLNIAIKSLPELIRLNPTIPWKTRGNGAVAIRGFSNSPVKLKKEVIKLVDRLKEEDSNPGIVFFEEDPRDINKISKFSKTAVKKIVNFEDAIELAKNHGDFEFFGNGRGIIGALAAAGYNFNDFTYEMIAYRKKKRWGDERKINEDSVWKGAEKGYPYVWDTIDKKNNDVVFTPNSPCPVLFGIRGDDINEIKKVRETIKCEEISMERIFKTNQGTDEHLQKINSIKNIKQFNSVIVEGKVSSEPTTLSGGHVIFSISDKTGEIDCAAYEPTKGFRNIVRKLEPGDLVKIYGSVRSKPTTLNIEKIDIKSLEKVYKLENPECPKCGKNMKSAGSGQGYRCRRCKTAEDSKKKIQVDRDISIGKYEVPPIARRHLSKPLIRFKRNSRN